MDVFGDKYCISPNYADAVSQLFWTVEVHVFSRDEFGEVLRSDDQLVASKSPCSAIIEVMSLISFVRSSQRCLPSRTRSVSCVLRQYGTARLSSASPARVRRSRRSR